MNRMFITETLDKLRGLETHLRDKIKGQDHVLEKICSLLEGGELGLNPSDKPLGSFLFLGPTGVGKTETTLQFGEYLFGKDHVFRFDMSEFLHIDNVKLFLGDETGRQGRLGNVLAQNQKGVLLFDEIDKAHPQIWDLFLQMLDAARITLSDHVTYDLSGFYIVCTSNIGSRLLLRPTRLPFTSIERAVLSELHKFFRPELIGRFDTKIVFKPLTLEVQREIVQYTLAQELKHLHQKGFNTTISHENFEFLLRKGMHTTFGARPLKKAIQKFISDSIRYHLKNGIGTSAIQWNLISST